MRYITEPEFISILKLLFDAVGAEYVPYPSDWYKGKDSDGKVWFERHTWPREREVETYWKIAELISNDFPGFRRYKTEVKKRKEGRGTLYHEVSKMMINLAWRREVR
jgi:hypothetical protein